MSALKFLLRLHSTVFFCSLHLHAMELCPDIIMLNGSGSAGKSTLAKELQQQLPHYRIESLDDFRTTILVAKARELNYISADFVYSNMIDFMNSMRQATKDADTPEKVAKKQSWQLQLQTGHAQFYEHIATLVQRGEKCIVDTVIFDDKLAEIKNRLRPFSVYYIFVHVPLRIVTERVRMRNESSTLLKERRLLPYVFRFYFNHYRAKVYTESMLKEKIDRTEIRDTVELALGKGAQLRIGGSTEDLIKNMVETLSLPEDDSDLYLSPRLLHDQIINTHAHDPVKATQLIMDGISTAYLAPQFWRNLLQ
jgi:chloramphenicol 3-O-phosphotransferase